MSKLQFVKLALILVFVGPLNSANAATFYVKAGSSGGNGSSWKKAFNNLDDALNASTSGSNQIWVAKGTYKPSIRYGGGYNGSESNLVTFNLPNNVSIYGGFVGTENSISKRNPDKNPTILSGDINGNDIPGNFVINKSDNAWHVLTADGTTNVLIDGFIIQDGYAAGPDSGTVTPNDFTGERIATLDYAHDAGGALIARHGARVTLNNIKFIDNAADSVRATIFTTPPASPLAAGGGAIASMDSGTTITINNSSFKNNAAINAGCKGGALNGMHEGGFTITNTIFTYNQAVGNGGAIHLRAGGDTTISTSIFENNSITGFAEGNESGGAISSFDNNLTVSNSVFNGNQATASVGSAGALFFHLPANRGLIRTLGVDHSVFTNNNGSTTGGGAVFIFGVLPNSASSAHISSSTFSGNTGSLGGAIMVDSLPATVHACTFFSNQAWVGGGAVFGSNFSNNLFDITNLADRTLLDISDSVFDNNRIIGLPANAVPPAFIYNLLAEIIGGAIGFPLSAVTAIPFGGGAVASEMGGRIGLTNCELVSNSALDGDGGAILVGGATGTAGTSTLGFNQAYLSVINCSCSGNTDQFGADNTDLLDPAGLGNGDNGVKFVTNGGCQL